jgi:alpha-galactosidase
MRVGKTFRFVLGAASLLLGCLLAASRPQPQRPAGIALTPPMGWNSWNHFECKVSDVVVRAQADAMVASGMKAASYEYVNIDDCWQGQRDA